jgi:DNA-binding MarR family transcriptional regulator
MAAVYRNFDHRLINKLLQNRLRMAILASVAHSDEVEFSSLKDSVRTTDGNLSIQLKNLSDEGLIAVRKFSGGNRPQTTVALTEKGRVELEKFRDLIASWFTFE